MMHTIETPRYRFMSGEYLLFTNEATHFMTKQVTATRMIKTIGRILKKNSFNSEFAGVNKVSCELAIKQSKLRNDSLGDPTLSVCENTPLKTIGILMLNVNAVEINCT